MYERIQIIGRDVRHGDYVAYPRNENFGIDPGYAYDENLDAEGESPAILVDDRNGYAQDLEPLERYVVFRPLTNEAQGILRALAAMPTTDEIAESDPDATDSVESQEVLDQYILRAREIVK